MENPCKTRSYSISCNHLLTVSLVKPLACRNSHQYPSFYVRRLLPTASLHLTHKRSRRRTLHTSIRSAAITLTHKAAHQWVSGRRLPWQHIPSHVAAWSERWRCWTSPLSALHCCSRAAIWNFKMVQPRCHQPHRCCWLVGRGGDLSLPRHRPVCTIGIYWHYQK